MNKKFLFVYGTLRSAASNPCENYGATHVSEATFKGGDLFDLGWYPGLKIGGDGEVKGDVYEVDDTMIPRLDAYEGCPNLYQRKNVNIDGFGEVMVYEYNGNPHNRPKVANGDWLNYNKPENYSG